MRCPARLRPPPSTRARLRAPGSAGQAGRSSTIRRSTPSSGAQVGIGSRTPRGDDPADDGLWRLSGRQYNNILTQYGDSLTNPDSAVHMTRPYSPSCDRHIGAPGAFPNLQLVDSHGDQSRRAQPAYQWDTRQPDSQFVVFRSRGPATGIPDHPSARSTGWLNGLVYGVVRYPSDDADCDVLGNTTVTDPTQRLATTWCSGPSTSTPRWRPSPSSLCRRPGDQGL